MLMCSAELSMEKVLTSQASLNIESLAIILTKSHISKMLIRLLGCTGWSAHLMFAFDKDRFLTLRLIYEEN